MLKLKNQIKRRNQNKNKIIRKTKRKIIIKIKYKNILMKTNNKYKKVRNKGILYINNYKRGCCLIRK